MAHWFDDLTKARAPRPRLGQWQRWREGGLVCCPVGPSCCQGAVPPCSRNVHGLAHKMRVSGLATMTRAGAPDDWEVWCMTLLHWARSAGTMGLLLCLLARTAQAEWVDIPPAQFIPNEPTVILTWPSDASAPLVVQSHTPGDLQWIVVHLPVTATNTITAVEICYYAPDAGTVIRQTRLVEYLDPLQAFVTHDDATVLRSPTAVCYRSPVAAYRPAVGGSLWLRLEFADPADQIVIDSVRIEVH
jgi:hypothetical protein